VPALHSHAQKLSGTVLDSQTNKPLPYVHIGVMDKNMGVISAENGKFEIDLSKADKNDQLLFSMLGYEIVKMRIADISVFDHAEIKLVQKLQQLKEVVVHNKKLKPIKLGRFTPSHTTIGHSRTEELGLGGEWGLQISNNGKKYWIDDVQFHLRFNTVDSILFRIQIYSVKSGLPNESLLSRDAFATSRADQHWIVKDFRQDNLILNEDVIVTFEVVRIWWSKKSDNQFFITYGKGYGEGKSFSRASSLDKWAVGERPPVTMFMTVSDY
jgi:hypothetical protein